MSPMYKGSSKKTISKNVKELMHTGKYSQRQSVAIAMKKAGKAKRKVKRR